MTKSPGFSVGKTPGFWVIERRTGSCDPDNSRQLLPPRQRLGLGFIRRMDVQGLFPDLNGIY
jgi:hypothetical protein